MRMAWPLAGAMAGMMVVAALGLAACSGQPVGDARNQRCGTIKSAAGGRVTHGTATTADWFWRAYAQCQSATLIFSVMGVDTTDTHTLTVQPGNGGCTISDAVAFYRVSGNFHSSRTYQCVGARQSADGLVIEQCGAEGNLVIAAPDGTPVP